MQIIHSHRGLHDGDRTLTYITDVFARGHQVYDKMQIIHSDRGLDDGGRTLTAARACGLTQSN